MDNRFLTSNNKGKKTLNLIAQRTEETQINLKQNKYDPEELKLSIQLTYHLRLRTK